MSDEIGDVITLGWTIKVDTVLTDATVALTIIQPDGTVVAPAVTHVSTGTYSADFLAAQNGMHGSRWLATGAVQAAEDGQFYVSSPPAAFATTAQLASSLGVDVPTDPLVLSRWQDALEDASGYLRTLIGQPISRGTASLALTTDDRGEADLWLVPVTAVSITDPLGNVLTADQWELIDQRLNLRRANTTYTVTVGYGYTIIPAEIVRWTKVLAATQIQVAANGSLGMSNISSVAIDDAKISYTDAMAVVMPDGAAQWLKATFGGPQ